MYDVLPQSNGMAESFVKTFKRDYAQLADRPDSKTVMNQLPGWFEDYNSNHPHSALGYLPPKLFRERQSASYLYRRVCNTGSYPPKKMGIHPDAPAPSEQRARASPVKNDLTSCSWINFLRVWSLLKTRGDSIWQQSDFLCT